ncbi:DUF6164 family protein [Gammaproteobacteria bacterium]|jgi:hypothetical protein|nr:DUF6164 family protein [Gammaproteobacteria bacterium]
MATQLVKLRQVPADELEEIYALMQAHEIEVYETGAGNWGISMPALWLSNDDQLEQAKALLKQHEEERFQRMRDEYEALKEEGKARTFLDIARENPVRYVAYIVMIAGLVYISVVPFWALLGE